MANPEITPETISNLQKTFINLSPSLTISANKILINNRRQEFTLTLSSTRFRGFGMGS